VELTDNISKQTKYLLYFLLAVVIYFVFFHRLGSFYMRTWDESIYAVNSFEMIERGNYIVPYINGNIDIINDKPPLFFWHQIISFKLFGYNEFAARFPSALYGALTVILLFSFLAKKYNFILGFTSAIVLATSMGFATFHSSRTGDMDSMLAFGVLAMAINFIKFKESASIKYYLFFAFFLVFAFLTKTLGALIILPIFYILLFKDNYKILFNIKFQAINLLIVFAIGMFLYFRNNYEDHYFTTHFLGYFGRFKTQYNADHDQPFDFYFNNLINVRYSMYSALLIPATYLVYKEQNTSLRNNIGFALISAIFFLLILSLSSSKCYWYDVPLYPLFAIAIGYFIWKIAYHISANLKSITLFILLFLTIPSYFAIKRSHNNDITDVNARKCEVIPEYFHNHKNMPYTSISVVDGNYNSPTLFYKYHFRQYKKEIKITQGELLKANEIVIAGNDSIKNYITTHYQTEQLETYKNATIYKIKQ